MADVESAAVPAGNKKARRAVESRFDLLPGTGVRMLCKCGVFVPLARVDAHAREVHSAGSRRPLICSAGCGYFAVSGSRGDVEKHMRSKQCRDRMVAIRKLVSGSSGV